MQHHKKISKQLHSQIKKDKKTIELFKDKITKLLMEKAKLEDKQKVKSESGQFSTPDIQNLKNQIMQEKEKKEEEEKKKQLEEEKKIKNYEKESEIAKMILAPEPDENNPDVCHIKFRLPDGEKIKERRFLKTDKISVLYDYIKSIGREIFMEPDSTDFDILCYGFPPKNLEDKKL